MAAAVSMIHEYFRRVRQCYLPALNAKRIPYYSMYSFWSCQFMRFLVSLAMILPEIINIEDLMATSVQNHARALKQ